MKCLKLQDGDLSLGNNQRASFVYAHEKLVQDLKLWLLEPLGVGFSTPLFGSQLHDAVGVSISDELAAFVRTEIERVISMYQTTQVTKLQAASQSGNLRFFSKREILNQLVEVSVTGSVDVLVCVVEMATLLDETLQLSLDFSLDGISA